MINPLPIGLYLQTLQTGADFNRPPNTNLSAADAARLVQALNQGNTEGGAGSARVLQVLPNQAYRLQVGEREIELRLAGQFKVGELLSVQNAAAARPGAVVVSANVAANLNPQPILSAADNALLARVPRSATVAIQPAADANRSSGSGSAPLALSLAAKLASSSGEPAVAKIAAQTTAQAEATLSDAARLLLAITGSEKSEPRKPLAAIVAEPLLDDAPREPSQLADALAKSVQRSGLFYESHLARWATHSYAQSELLAEPQTRWPADADQQSTGKTATPNPQPTVTVLPAQSAMIQQQLQVLETQQLLWQGTLWPGHQAEIAITEERSQKGAEEETAIWTTQLKVTLPSLGELSATLTLRAANVQLQFEAQSAASVSKLREALPDLIGTFRKSGLSIIVLGLKHVR